MAFDKTGLTDQDKEMVIAQALETDEGRTALAQAMVEPIRRSLEYQAVGRKLLLVDELPQGALARYERDVAAIAHVIARRGAVPDQIQEGKKFSSQRSRLLQTHRYVCQRSRHVGSILLTVHKSRQKKLFKKKKIRISLMR